MKGMEQGLGVARKSGGSGRGQKDGEVGVADSACLAPRAGGRFHWAPRCHGDTVGDLVALLVRGWREQLLISDTFPPYRGSALPQRTGARFMPVSTHRGGGDQRLGRGDMGMKRAASS